MSEGAVLVIAPLRALGRSQGIIVVVQLRRPTMPASASTSSSSSGPLWPQSPDPYLSLELLDDPAAMAWVEQQNARTRAAWCSGAPFDTPTRSLPEAYLPR